MLHIKPKADMDPEVIFKIAEAVSVERHQRLRLLVRVSSVQGSQYEYPAFVTMRDLFGSALINLHTWEHVYGGNRLSEYYVTDYSHTLHGRGAISANVDAATLLAERDVAAGTVSRETVPVSVPDLPGRVCTCDDCTDSLCVGAEDDDHESCDDHGCEECYGEDYSCDDHACDHCFGDHSVESCCGYCSECGSHPGDKDEDQVCPNCSFCRDCDHDCDNY